MSTSLVSSDRADVVFAVTGPPTDLPYTVMTFVDRWDGEGWVGESFLNSCLDSGDCWGEFGDDADRGSPRIGLNIDSTGVGPAEYVRLSGLDEGWYRLRKDMDIADGVASGEEVATAVFEVSDAVSAVAAPAPELGTDRLIVTPVVTGTGGSRMNATVTVSSAVVTPTLALYRYEAGAWRFVVDFTTFTAGARAGNTVDLRAPALPPGAYRLSSSSTRDTVVGRFWVSEEISSPVTCPGVPDLVELLGTDGEAFGEAAAPGGEVRPAFEQGGFHVQWESPESTVVYSNPVGGVRDLVGERTVAEGPVMLWYRDDAVEAWVQLPGCADEDPVTAGFTVTGGSEQENVTLALRLGRELARRENPDFAAATRTDCPGPDSPDPDTPNAVHDVWLYCRTSADQEPELVPVPTIFSPGDPIEAVIRRSLGDPWNGLESAIPVELRGAQTTVEINDGVLTIDWGWDFSVSPIDNLGTSTWSGRIIDQIAANAFQFEQIDAVDLGNLPFDHGGEFVYTREQWEQSQAEN
ncbi:MAG: hypothetical protein R2707_07025 [Acidimicrobiales bacterium]